MTTTLYGHDYETFGVDPKRDRPAQFAGLRTDEALNEVGETLVIYCKPARDVLPHPEACLLTGITPQLAEAQGMPEPEFIASIHAELAQPGTCGVGYNTFFKISGYQNYCSATAHEIGQRVCRSRRDNVGSNFADIESMMKMGVAVLPLRGIMSVLHCYGMSV